MRQFLLCVLLTGLATCGFAACPVGDLNRDCRVDFLDMRLLAQQWLASPEKPSDFNGDDRVNAEDLALMNSNWQQAGIPLAINEFVASNSKDEDPQGQTDDWIEIYNYGEEPINTAGMYLTDDLDDALMWRFPDSNPALTTIQPGGYLVVWADEDTTDAGLHASFKLDADGEEIGFFDSDGSTLIDSIVFDEQSADISYGRYPDANDQWQFMASTTLNQANVGAYKGIVEDVQFSYERGFYEKPIAVTLACETEGVLILYTLNGNTPDSRGATIYTGPIGIDKTTTIRAQAFKTGFKSSAVTTRTFIYIEDVMTQSPFGRPPGPDWPSDNVNGQIIDYGMDPDVLNDPRYASLVDDALLAIPSISIVTNLDNLFDSATGIYVNARQDGRAWERPVSVELLNPDGTEGFQVNAGLRIRGAFSRSDGNPKHALRLFFRSEYGAGKLEYPLFGDEGTDEFDKIDLRTSQNNSWSFQGSSQNTLIRDVFSRDVQRDMGQPYTRSRYYHLYINGHYWGIYQTEERADADYAESYLGGDSEEYDVVKNDSSGSRALHATDGTIDAYRRLYDAAVAGFASDEAYFAVQGLRPDGTVDPTGEKMLDPENLMDYMICTYYTGDPDAPVSCWAHFSNNVFAIYNWLEPQGFTWFRHDAEHSLGANGGVTEGRLLTDPTDRSIGQEWRYFNPAWLHLRLTANKKYLMKFADRVEKYFSSGGVLTASRNAQRWMDRADQIDLAIIAESARWGDSKRHPPLTKADWQGQNNYMLNTYFPNRNQIVIDQMRSVGMFPRAAMVSFSQEGGKVSPGFRLAMSQYNGTSGTIYYSVDGNDPGQPAGTEVKTRTLCSYEAPKRVLIPEGAVSEDWKGGHAYDDTNWMYTSGAPGGVGYERSYGYDSRISLDVEGLMYGRRTSCYIRIPFTLPNDPAEFNLMTLNLRYDDAFVAYINGSEVDRREFVGVPAWNSRADGSHEDSGGELFDISDNIGVLREGSNILAIHAMNIDLTSSDFLIAAELRAGSRTSSNDPFTDSAQEYSSPVPIDRPTHVMARVFSSGQWGPLHERTFGVGPVRENLRITELMYHPGDPADANDPNEEYVELRNVGTETISLNLVSFTDGIDFTFPDLELAGGENIVVVQDRTAFEARYGEGIRIAGQYTGRLDNAGEKVRLQDAVGETILDFAYKDGWRSITDGEGFSLTMVNPEDSDPARWGDKDSWRASAYVGGSPGGDDSGIIPNPGAVVINEVLAHSHNEAADWVELHNTTAKVIDIGGWFLSDSGDDLARYQIEAGTKIYPYEYLVLREDLHFNNPSSPGCITPFALSENGETLYLCSGEAQVITGYRAVEDFGASETGVSFGRHYKASTDNYNFVPMAQITPDGANSYPKVGPIVITEVMYHPDWPAGGAHTNDQYEYIEIRNISGNPMALYSYDKFEPWRFTDGIEFVFPAEMPVTIMPDECLLLVKNVDAFTWRYPTVPSDTIVGAYDGSLSNAGEKLELSMPGDVDKDGRRRYIRVDRVAYSDGSHPDDCPNNIDIWPMAADGGGKALHRKVFGNYGNDPNNWITSAPSPGQ